MHSVTVSEWKSVHKRLDDLENTVKDLKSKLGISGNRNDNQNLNLETEESVETERMEINIQEISVEADVVIDLPDPGDQLVQESLTLATEANICGLQPVPTSSCILGKASSAIASTSIKEIDTEDTEEVMRERVPSTSSLSFSIPRGVGIHDQNTFEKSRRAIVSLRRCDETDVLARRASVESSNERNKKNSSTVNNIKCNLRPGVPRKPTASSSHGEYVRHIGPAVPIGEKRRRYKCPICSRKFTTRSNLSTHNRVHTGEKPYTCHVCAKTFKYQGSWTVHLRLHTGKIPYTCQFCPKAFNASYDLTRHLRVHTGEKPYQCQFCSKCFSQPNGLTLHTHLHTGEKPYQCQFCSKCFSQLPHLTSHTHVHTGEKPYRCHFCSKCFSQQASLTLHTRVHTGEKPYRCQYCTKTYGHPASFANHMRTHTD